MSTDEKQARSYSHLKTVIFFSQLFSTLIFLTIFYVSGLSLRLARFATSASLNETIFVLLYLLFFSCLFFFLKLFFSFLEEYLLEKKFSLFAGKVSTWFKDFLKGFFIELALFIIFVEFLYFFLKRGNLWWLYIWVFYLFLTIILAKISPYIILPLFFKFSPLNNPGLKVRIEKLAGHFRLKIKNLWVVNFSRKTKKANAFVSGLGRGKRVVLADNLINNYSEAEVEAVIAHEFAHVKNRDTLRAVALLGLGSLAVFYFLSLFIERIAAFMDTKIYYIETLPLFLIFFHLFVFLWLPFQNFFLRQMEKLADKEALRAISDKDSFISLMERLASNNLAEKFPPKWKEIIFYNHPPIGKRIAMARSWKKEDL